MTVDIQSIQAHLHSKEQAIKNIQMYTTVGTLTRTVGLTLEGRGFDAAIGDICYISQRDGLEIEAVVTGFSADKIFLMPTSHIQGLEVGSKIRTENKQLQIPCGEALLGRIIDPSGRPLDDKPPIVGDTLLSLHSVPINPLHRAVIKEPLDLGVRAINGLVTVGRGQRIGLFAGSGVGKSVLLGMIARFSQADVVVVGLIGERGREVKEFIENNLGAEGLKKTVVVAAPADYSAVLRMHGSYAAMSIAEYFRDKGQNVLLLMDSLTRFCQARREIALSMGEPPATKGYPPSVFGLLPELVERAGMGGKKSGSITGIFTVLAEGDDHNDPIVDAARAILDGHIVLSRKYADMGHYPAIDVCASVSRVMTSVTEQKQQLASKDFKRYYSLYNENKDLVNIGAYVPGANHELDFAISQYQNFNHYLQQGIHERASMQDSVKNLYPLINRPSVAAAKEEPEDR